MWRRWGTPENFLLAFVDELWKTWKIRILKKWKKKNCWDIIILHMCTKSHNHRKYSSWDLELDRIFCHFGWFFAFLPTTPNNPENQNLCFQNLCFEKRIWICHHFKLVQQQARSHDVCLPRYQVQQTTFCYFRPFFLFYPTTGPEN